MSMQDTTHQKLQSLRIDPTRKLPSRSTGAVLYLAVGAAIGLGGSFAFMTLTGVAPSAGKYQPGAANGAVPPAANPTSGATTPSTTPNSGTPAKATPAPAKAGEVVLTSTGYVTPRQRIALSPRVMGQVTMVGIEKGDHVTKDQVLVRLRDGEYLARQSEAEAHLLQAQAKLREWETGARPEEIERARASVRELQAALSNAESTLQRRETLQAGNIESRQLLDDAGMNRDMAQARLEWAQNHLRELEAGTRKEVIDAARADVEAARAAADYAKIQVEDTVIKAPIDGTILEKLIEVGELVSPQNFGGTRGARTELLSLADLSDLQVEVDINESDFAKISMGQLARVTLDAYPDKQYDAKVREIAPEANRAKATVQVKVQILNPDRFIMPEMGARVDFLAK